MLALCQEYLDPVKATIHHGITTLLLVPADLSGTVGVLVTTTASLAERNATSNASHPNFLIKLLFIFTIMRSANASADPSVEKVFHKILN